MTAIDASSRRAAALPAQSTSPAADATDNAANGSSNAPPLMPPAKIGASGYFESSSSSFGGASSSSSSRSGSGHQRSRYSSGNEFGGAFGGIGYGAAGSGGAGGGAASFAAQHAYGAALSQEMQHANNIGAGGASTLGSVGVGGFPLTLGSFGGLGALGGMNFLQPFSQPHSQNSLSQPSASGMSQPLSQMSIGSQGMSQGINNNNFQFCFLKKKKSRINC